MRRTVPTVAIGGGGLVVAGALLPWLTLFAGLQRYAGIAGLNGRLLLAGGALAIVLGAAALVRPAPVLLHACALLGAALTGLAGWALVGLVAMVRHGRTDPMLMAGYGPGLFVACAGTLALALAPVLCARSAPLSPAVHTAKRPYFRTSFHTPVDVAR